MLGGHLAREQTPSGKGTGVLGPDSAVVESWRSFSRLESRNPVPASKLSTRGYFPLFQSNSKESTLDTFLVLSSPRHGGSDFFVTPGLLMGQKLGKRGPEDTTIRGLYSKGSHRQRIAIGVVACVAQRNSNLKNLQGGGTTSK